jgi:hypothetical protein
MIVLRQILQHRDLLQEKILARLPSKYTGPLKSGKRNETRTYHHLVRCSVEVLTNKLQEQLGDARSYNNISWRKLQGRSTMSVVQCAMCKGETKKKVKVRELSCLRKTDKENIANFSFERLEKELKENAPLFQLVLKTASLRVEDRSKSSMMSIGVAAAVCLKNRSRNMTAFQLVLAIITLVFQ